MITSKIKKIIVKYITKSASTDDLNRLTKWIDHKDNINVFKEYVKTHYAITYTMNNPNSKNALTRLLIKIRKEKSLTYRIKSQFIFKYAAAAILVIASASIYFISNKSNYMPKIVNQQIEPGTDKAILTLEDGTVLMLEKGTKLKTQNASINGEAIIYDNKTSNPLVYNYLTIPRGGQFQLTLSDGTQVWLNSESQLKYQVSFTDGETRKVELVYGEAYFDVSSSINHKDAGFEVYHKRQEVHVMGTQFNIKAYKTENNIFTTLVEGEVSVKYDDKYKTLKPDEQSNYNIINNTLSVSEVDVYNETSWKDGVFSFDGKSLKEIMTVLSRWYNVEVVFENSAVESEEFIGVLGKNQNLENILASIKNFGVFEEFQINDKKVIIK